MFCLRLGFLVLICAVGCRDVDSDADASGDGSGGSEDSCVFETYGCGGLAACFNGIEYADSLACDLSDAQAQYGYECSLLALRDNISSALQINTCGGSCGYYDTVYVLGDGTAAYQRRHCVMPGEPPNVEPFRRVLVRAPEYFQACLDGGPIASVSCLSDWFEPGSCIPGACCSLPNSQGLPAC